MHRCWSWPLSATEFPVVVNTENLPVPPHSCVIIHHKPQFSHVSTVAGPSEMSIFGLIRFQMWDDSGLLLWLYTDNSWHTLHQVLLKWKFKPFIETPTSQVFLTFSEAPRRLGVMMLADVERGTNPRGFWQKICSWCWHLSETPRFVPLPAALERHS
jgi:hypothetical protein